MYRPNADGNGWSETYQDYTFPLSYSKGRFILTLDAMCDANCCAPPKMTVPT